MASNGNTNRDLGYNIVHGPAGDARSPRQPSEATRSRVLNIIKNNDQESKKKQQQQQQAQQITLPVVSPHKLSVDAVEFVPRAKQPVPQAQMYQDPSLSVAAEEFYPRANDDYAYNQYYMNAEMDPNNLVGDFGSMNLQGGSQNYYNNSAGGDLVLAKFHEALYILTMHPANMEDYLRPICDLIHCGQGGNTDVTNMVESLFEQSLQESNFRYTGARVCQFLSSQLKDTPQFTGFQKMFIKRCQKEFEKRAELLNGTPEEADRLRGLAMFMAEVFLNVQFYYVLQTLNEDGSVQRLHFLPRVLLDLLQCLLSKPNDLNVKCACQLCKLSGALIEDIVKNMPDQCVKFEETFTTLQSLQESPDVSEDAKSRISNVISLKESNWNRNTSSPPKKTSNFANNSNSFQRQEPVFYNHLGVMCSRVEAGLPDEEYDENVHILNDEEEEALREFEAEQDRLTGRDTSYDFYGYDEGADDGGGMGAEEEAAYEEFLQEQQFHIQQQQQQQQQQQHSHNYAPLPQQQQQYSNFGPVPGQHMFQHQAQNQAMYYPTAVPQNCYGYGGSQQVPAPSYHHNHHQQAYAQQPQQQQQQQQQHRQQYNMQGGQQYAPMGQHYHHQQQQQLSYQHQPPHQHQQHHNDEQNQQR